MKELEIDAKVDNLPQVLAFIDEALEEAECGMKAQMQIDIAVEEIYVNIAHYAYAPGEGKAVIRMEIGGEPKAAKITFLDRGVPYDPLAREDPDVTLSAEERSVGGLGIFMVKKSMDDVFYSYEDGQNVLTITKNLI
ncbi:MAG: ATP-binding protein [Lachnospiraceae bacterium]|nr:ATP-binding protein [Lachnospiraceae bacterium]